MPTTVAITNSTGTFWSLASNDTPSNTALGARMHDLAFFIEGSSTTFGMARPGVIAGAGLTAANTPLSLFVSPTGTGLGVQVNPGSSVIERGTFTGPGWSTLTPAGTYPYIGAMKSTATFTANAANALSGTRIDRVDQQLMDGPGYSDNGGTTVAQIIYTAGTVGSGVAANAPANTIPLGLITFPSGTTTTLTSGMFTDMRRATSLRGATRMLMGGDALTDPGFVAGEFRMRYNSTYGWLEDFWDPVNSLWHGTQTLEIAQPAQAGSGSNAAGTTGTIASLVITDPGWPYHIVSGGCFEWTNSSGAAVASIDTFARVQVDSTTAGTNQITLGYRENSTASTGTGYVSYCATKSSKAIQPSGYTGSHTVYLLVTTVGSGPSNIVASSSSYQFFIELVPA